MQSRALWLMHSRNWAIDYGRRWRLTFYHVLCSYPIDGILVHSSHPAHRQVCFWTRSTKAELSRLLYCHSISSFRIHVYQIIPQFIRAPSTSFHAIELFP